jgi:hypothetical protein
LLGDLTFEINSSAAFDHADQRAGLILLGSMLLLGFIRFSTRMIRAEVSWWPGNVTPGGLHIHHLVFGIVLMMFSGFLNFVFEPPSPWFEILAGVFGVGVGLTLDEFALWLYLDDVYWAEQGRSSVDAVVFAAIIGGGIIVGFVPLDASGGSIIAIVVSVAITLGICGRRAQESQLGRRHVHPAVAWRRRPPGPPGQGGRTAYTRERQAGEAETRKTRHDKRVRRFQDLIGGAPSLPTPRTGAGSKPPPD